MRIDEDLHLDCFLSVQRCCLLCQRADRAKGDVEILSGNVKLAMSHVVPDLIQMPRLAAEANR